VIPTASDLESDPLVHCFGDLFNPPALTNFRGTLQAAMDVTAIRCLSFPPFSCSDSFPPVSWTDSTTGALFVDGHYFAASGRPITFSWRPDQIRREAEYRGLFLQSVTVMPPGYMAALVRLRVTNRTGEKRTVGLRLGMKATVTMTVQGWDDAVAPAEHDNEIHVDAQRGAVLFRARGSAAVSLQGIVGDHGEADDKGVDATYTLAPGQTCELFYLNVIEDEEDHARRAYDELAVAPAAEIERTEAEWNREIAAAFTPGNDRFSGSLPVLETANPALERLYLQGLLALLYHRRESPVTHIGRTYTTLMPRYWQTICWPWDHQIASVAHALLDPAVTRKLLEHWMASDIHQFMGTDWLTGEGVGEEYAVNDFAVTKIALDYVRWSGHRAWLNETVVLADGREEAIIDRLVGYMRNWDRLRRDSGLADYGNRANLLECVASYTNEVAGLNIANVFSLRSVASMLELVGRAGQAATMRKQAERTLDAVRKLYVAGSGYWHARHASGRLVPVRHAFDLLTALNLIPDELEASQRAEMVRFFTSELQTPTWMHAMSPLDADVIFDIRPDHQWSGAYVAWPAETATGLLRIGEEEVAARWLEGIAKTARQGPFGQAHFADGVVAGEVGGARKAPSDFPYLTDWACVGGGAWARVILEGVFGIDASLANGITASPRLGLFDPDARLVDLAYQGELSEVDATGVRRRHRARGG